VSRTLVSAAALVVLLSACAAAPQVDVAAEEQAVRAVSSHWLELDRARDAAGIAALFADDGVAYRPHQEPVVGRAAIQEHMARGWRDEPQESESWTTDRVDVAASGDQAVERGTWSSTGASTGPDQGWYMTEYRKVGGEWQVVADMVLTTKPAPAPAAPSAPPAN